MSAATSFYATFQQMARSTGIAVSAAALAGSTELTGHAGLQTGDFPVALVAVAGIAPMAPLSSTRSDRAAGAELSGARARVGG